MKFITLLAFTDPRQYLPIARACDEAGFDGLALSDHLVHPQKLETRYPYSEDGRPRWEPFTPWPDPWVAAGYMAAVTRKLRFLTNVYVLPLRHPLLVAKTVATAACLAGGRIALGVGVGWMREEFAACGQPFERRGARAREMIEVLRKLWAGGYVEHRGEFYAFDPLEMSPTPPGEVPIYGGGLSEPALRRAAEVCDGWISDFHTTDELREFIRKLRAYRADSPRAGRPLEVIVTCRDAVDVDGYRRLAEIGVTHVETQPWVYFRGLTGELDERLDGIARFADEVVHAFD